MESQVSETNLQKLHDLDDIRNDIFTTLLKYRNELDAIKASTKVCLDFVFTLNLIIIL